MKKLTQILTLAAMILVLLSCKKEDTKPTTGGGGKSGGKDTTTNMGALKTYSMAVSIDDSQTINAETSSYLDKNKNTHIAWIETKNKIRSVMYSLFNAKSHAFSTKTVHAGKLNENNVSPEIVVDNSGNIHIVYFVKRDKKASSKTGNYAVMYATSSGGGFTLNQVSTNAKTVTDNSKNNFHCYVNGRPKIFLKGSIVNVIYMAAGSNLNGYDKYFIQATKSGASWSRKQLVNAQDHASTNVDRGLSVAQNVSTLYGAQISLGKYTPFFLSAATAWKKQLITGYDGTFANKHIQLIEDKDNKTHISWFNVIGKKFCYGVVKGSTVSKIEEVPIKVKNSGNFFPSTVDKVTNEHIFFYHDYSGNGYLITKSGAKETKIDTKDIGVIYGNNALHMDNGYISLLTASESDGKIYMTTNNYLK